MSAYLQKTMIVLGAVLIAIGLMSFDPSSPDPDLYGSAAIGWSYGWIAKTEVAFGVGFVVIGTLCKKQKP